MQPDDEAVRQFAPGSVDGTSRATPLCWKVLDPTTALRQLRAMDEWVQWLASHYTLTPRTIPPCWYHHGALVEELSALRTGWQAAFAPDAPGIAPLDWHVQFWAARNRLEVNISRAGCTKDDHREDEPATWLSAHATHPPTVQ